MFSGIVNGAPAGKEWSEPHQQGHQPQTLPNHPTADSCNLPLVHIRDDARTGTLSRRDETVADIASRFDQLIRYAALVLGSVIGEDVSPVLSKAEREDPSLRMSSLVDTLAQDGVLDGALRIPNTAGDFGITADLCAQQLAASLQVDAPKDRGARGRVSWLVNQLREAPGTTAIESYPKNARTPIIASLSDARDSRDAAIGDDKREPVRFRVVLRVPMGTLRESGGKRPGFIDSVLALITSFYECVVQDINPWQPSAPKIKRSEPEPGDEEQSNSYLPATIPSPDSDGD